MGLHGILAWIVIGTVAGWLTGKIMRGDGYGFIGDIVVGIIGAFIGGWLAGKLGISIGSGLIASIITATIGAVILVLILRMVRNGPEKRAAQRNKCRPRRGATSAEGKSEPSGPEGPVTVSTTWVPFPLRRTVVALGRE